MFRATLAGTMKLEPFAMERLQSTWENRVAWNLSESGVHPLRVEELAVNGRRARTRCSRRRSGYTQTNGTLELRRGDRGDVSRRHAPITSR